MRILKLPAPVVALILSALAESVVFLIVRIFGVIGYRHFGALQDYYFYFFVYIHGALFMLLESVHLLPQNSSSWTLVAVAVVQWWLIFMAAIWTFRYFRRRHDKAA